MNTSENNAKAFTDAIRKMAKDRCDEIKAETQFIKKQRTATFKKDAEARYNSYVEYELTRISTEKNREISAIGEKSRTELSSLRRELSDKVFDDAFKEIKKYTLTDEYLLMLINCVKEILERCEDCVFSLNSDDMKLCEKINSDIGKELKWSVDDSILLGGVKAVDDKSGCLYDNTLDVKFEKQKEWFFENSGLKI